MIEFSSLYVYVNGWTDDRQPVMLSGRCTPKHGKQITIHYTQTKKQKKTKKRKQEKEENCDPVPNHFPFKMTISEQFFVVSSHRKENLVACKETRYIFIRLLTAF